MINFVEVWTIIIAIKNFLWLSKTFKDINFFLGSKFKGNRGCVSIIIENNIRSMVGSSIEVVVTVHFFEVVVRTSKSTFFIYFDFPSSF